MKRIAIAEALAGLATAAAVLMTGASSATTPTSFSNPSPIVFPAAGSLEASPIPSTITVGSATGVVSHVTVKLKGVTHPNPDDVDVVLIGPGGQSSILMGDAGCSSALTGVDLTFDDDATDFLPDSTAIPASGSHTYKPTLGTTAPTCSSTPFFLGIPADLSTFTGTDPNGTWSLFVFDDNPVGNTPASIANGWQLSIATADTVVTASTSDANGAEGAAPDVGVFTLTRAGAIADALDVNVTMGGTATNGADYPAISTAHFDAGSATAVVTVTPSVDGTAEGDESVTLAVAPGTGYEAGDPSLATGMVIDDEQVVPTTTTLISSKSPSLEGESVNLTATVAGTGTTTDVGSPVGTVDFKDGATSLTGCDAVPLVNGSATCSHAFSATTTALTATFTPTDGDYATSASSPDLTQTVSNTVSVTASDAGAEEPSNDGTFTLHRTYTAGDQVVNYHLEGTATNGDDFTLLTGTATILDTQQEATVTVDVKDDAIDENAETVVLVVDSGPGYSIADPAPSATATIAGGDHANAMTLASGSNPSTIGDAVTFTATVTRTGTGITGAPVGAVTFLDLGSPDVVLCSLSGLDGDGKATCNAPALAAGPHTISAEFVPDSTETDMGAASVNLAQVVGPPMVTITASDADASEEGPDTGTFTVTRTGPTTSALTVNLGIDGTSTTVPGDYTPALPASIDIPIGEHSATFDITPVNDAAHESPETVIAQVITGTGYDVGTPSSATVTIADNDPAVPTTTTLASNHNPAAFPSKLTLTATVTSSGGTPTGTVDFIDGATTLCDDAPLDGTGKATCVVDGLTPGAHPLSAAYAGTGGFLASTSPTLNQSVNPPGGTAGPATVTGSGTATTQSRTFYCHGVPATIVGTGGDDNLVGTNGRDVIVGRGGSDVIDGRGGDDLICAGNGDDVVNGGSGDDVIYGQRGDDDLSGDGGSDVLIGGRGSDVLSGGGGSDDLRGGGGTDTATGSVSGDSLTSIERRD